jgi:hypothetical protein
MLQACQVSRYWDEYTDELTTLELRLAKKNIEISPKEEKKEYVARTDRI